MVFIATSGDFRNCQIVCFKAKTESQTCGRRLHPHQSPAPPIRQYRGFDAVPVHKVAEGRVKRRAFADRVAISSALGGSRRVRTSASMDAEQSLRRVQNLTEHGLRADDDELRCAGNLCARTNDEFNLGIGHVEHAV